MKINLYDLEKSLNLLISSFFESEFIPDSAKESKALDISYDFYWSVPLGTRDNIIEKVENDIGSIDHDIERLIQLLEENEPNTHHFRYLGNVLIAVADTLESQNYFL
jgi:hypothetical protein